MARLRLDLRPYRCVDLLAWGDPSYIVATIPGRDRCSMGQAWKPPAKRAAERSAQITVAQFLLRHDDLWRARHTAGRPYSQRSALLLPWVWEIPSVHSPTAAHGQTGRNCENGRSEAGPDRGIRAQVFEQAPLALIRPWEEAFSPRTRCLPRRPVRAHPTLRTLRRFGRHARPLQAPACALCSRERL
jgi:hypothetical protein